MKKYFLLFAVLTAGLASAQDVEKLISQSEVERIEKILSSDEMEGRRTFTKGIDKAATFIAAEIKKTGLQTWNNTANYLQQVAM